MEKHTTATRWCRFCKYKLDVEENVTLVVRSNHAQPIQDVFAQINDRINEEMAAHPWMMWLCKKQKSHI
jgi:amidophosphoribosyltransferase